MIGRRGLSILATLILFSACSAWQTEREVTPSSYQTSREKIPRKVGKLRRMAVLPIRQSAPRICDDSGEIRVDYEHRYFTDAQAYLVSHKGYEIVRLDPARYQVWLTSPQNQEFLQEITHWSANSEADTPPGEKTTALLARIHEMEHTDGLMVFHIHVNCLMAHSAPRMFFGVFTLGLSEILGPSPEDSYTTNRVAIIETATSRPVWRKSARAGISKTPFGGRSNTDEDYLFSDLDPAVPKILTQ